MVGHTAVLSAISAGDEQRVRALIEAGYNVNKTDLYDLTALMIASSKGREHCGPDRGGGQH